MHSLSASLTVPILQSANLSKPPQYEAIAKLQNMIYEILQQSINYKNVVVNGN
jgi:hypothetical protein